jgi:Domain of unknown function (DUF4296)
MNKALGLIAVVMFLFACKEKTDHKRVVEPTMEKDQFINMLVDMRLLEGAYAIRYQRVDSTKGLMNAYYDQIFNKYGVDRDVFRNNYLAYSSSTVEMVAIEDSVLARLDRIPIKREVRDTVFKSTEIPIKKP